MSEIEDILKAKLAADNIRFANAVSVRNAILVGDPELAEEDE